MGCLFKTILFLPLLCLFFLPVMFWGIFKRSHRTTFRRSRSTDENTYSAGASQATTDSGKNDKPIDENTVEFIDFEEVKKKSSDDL